MFSASTRFPTIAIKKAAGTRPYSTTTATPDPIAYSRRSHICTQTHLTTYREINRNGPVIRSGNVACGEKRDGGSKDPPPAFVPVLLPNCGLCHGDVGVSCSAARAIAGLSRRYFTLIVQAVVAYPTTGNQTTASRCTEWGPVLW